MMGHRSLETLRVAVIGTGALGSALLSLLAAGGMADVLLIDPDRVQERNLALSPLLREAMAAEGSRRGGDPPPYKAALLAGEARRRYGLPWQAVCAEIAETGWQLLADRDLLFCCTDSALSRAETAWTARMLEKPVIEAGVFGDGIPECRVTWFPSAPEAACYLCGLREDRRAQVLAYAASASLGCAPLEDAPPMTGTPEALRQAAAEMLGLLHAFADGRSLDPAYPQRVCTGHPHQRQQPLLLHGTSSACRFRLQRGQWTNDSLQMPRSETCPWHMAPVGELLPLPWETSVRESLSGLGDGEHLLQLPWQICTSARCGACGTRVDPFARVAWVRRAMRCRACGSQGTMEPLAGTATVRKQDTLALRSPRELGQPEAHLYQVRRPVFAGETRAAMMRVAKP